MYVQSSLGVESNFKSLSSGRLSVSSFSHLFFFFLERFVFRLSLENSTSAQQSALCASESYPHLRCDASAESLSCTLETLKRDFNCLLSSRRSWLGLFGAVKWHPQLRGAARRCIPGWRPLCGPQPPFLLSDSKWEWVPRLREAPTNHMLSQLGLPASNRDTLTLIRSVGKVLGLARRRESTNTEIFPRCQSSVLQPFLWHILPRETSHRPFFVYCCVPYFHPSVNITFLHLYIQSLLCLTPTQHHQTLFYHFCCRSEVSKKWPAASVKVKARCWSILLSNTGSDSWRRRNLTRTRVEKLLNGSSATLALYQAGRINTGSKSCNKDGKL